MGQLEQPSLLIVDDEPYNVKVLVELLRPNYSIRVATNGEIALRIVMSNNPPDLVLLDIIMPGIDGYEVCRRIKTEPTTQDIPVIFITSKMDAQDEIKGFEVGSVDYVTKPFNPIVVEARVKTHIDLKKKTELLRCYSMRDGLTGIANRRHFNQYLNIAWNYAIRDSSHLSLILIDIDHFKLYNDTYGHLVGDSCLIKIAKSIDESLSRKIDLAARYGGEEFVCILPKIDIDGAVIVSKKIHYNIQSLQIPHYNSKSCKTVSISQGVATIIPSKSSEPDDLIKMADNALYTAKNSGRNQFQVYGEN
ncbi:MAG: diguanylate cyclase [Desulfamplus sp.]|nr:diguanylate cyclase [Desulfamplus sp.]